MGCAMSVAKSSEESVAIVASEGGDEGAHSAVGTDGGGVGVSAH